MEDHIKRILKVEFGCLLAAVTSGFMTLPPSEVAINVILPSILYMLASFLIIPFVRKIRNMDHLYLGSYSRRMHYGLMLFPVAWGVLFIVVLLTADSVTQAQIFLILLNFEIGSDIGDLWFIHRLKKRMRKK